MGYFWPRGSTFRALASPKARSCSDKKVNTQNLSFLTNLRAKNIPHQHSLIDYKRTSHRSVRSYLEFEPAGGLVPTAVLLSPPQSLLAVGRVPGRTFADKTP